MRNDDHFRWIDGEDARQLIVPDVLRKGNDAICPVEHLANIAFPHSMIAVVAPGGIREFVEDLRNAVGKDDRERLFQARAKVEAWENRQPTGNFNERVRELCQLTHVCDLEPMVTGRVQGKVHARDSSQSV